MKHLKSKSANEQNQNFQNLINFKNTYYLLFYIYIFT